MTESSDYEAVVSINNDFLSKNPLYKWEDRPRKIQKIRSLSETVAAGVLRETGAFDGVRDMECRRWDWIFMGHQQTVTAWWPAESPERRLLALGGVRRSLNKWIQKNRVTLSEMQAAPPINK